MPDMVDARPRDLGDRLEPPGQFAVEGLVAPFELACENRTLHHELHQNDFEDIKQRRHARRVSQVDALAAFGNGQAGIGDDDGVHVPQLGDDAGQLGMEYSALFHRCSFRRLPRLMRNASTCSWLGSEGWAPSRVVASAPAALAQRAASVSADRKSTRLNSMPANA